MSDATPTPGTQDDDAPVVDPTSPEPDELYGQSVTWSRGQPVIHVDRAALADVVGSLRNDEGFDVCVDVTAVDYLTYTSDRAMPAGIEPERFEVVVNLRSFRHGGRIRIRVQVPESDAVVPTLFEVHPGTEAFEREVYDMFGIRFAGHPDLTRILMPEDWEGHPLRKDYVIGRIPVQFKGVVNER